ncbi:MAG: hypothetical protein OQL16_11365 [Gammaproteobacteria bacterium]|nr:hypothetical protein [Gammaproteobacteria bacterium]
MKIPASILLCLFALISVQVHSQEQETDAGKESTEDSWDWSSFEAMDDTPISSKGVIEKEATETPSRRLGIEEVTAPDMEAKPHRVYELFPGMPSFEVISSKKDTEMHPCSNCHEWQKSDKTPRFLKQPHDNFALLHGLHGKGQFWCFTCHDTKDKGLLKTMEGEYVNFEEAYILCSQCHVNQARDWAYGAHGKRVGNWKGKRQVYNCTACHYQHSPALRYRNALPGPVVRMGLERPAHWVPMAKRKSVVMKPEKLWEEHGQKGTGHE